MRIVVVAVLLGLLGCSSRVDELLKQLEHEDPRRREDAVRDLVRLRLGDEASEFPEPGRGARPQRGRDAEIARALTRRVRDDSDRHVRMAAARALARLRPPGRNDVLLDCAAHDRFADSYCADALLVVGDPANLEDMVALVGFSPEGDGGTRTMSLDIGKVGAPVIPHLATLIREGAKYPAMYAIRALGDVDTALAFDIVADSLQSDEPYFRRHAIETLARSELPRHRALIKKHLDDPSDGVRQAAARALGLTEPE